MNLLHRSHYCGILLCSIWLCAVRSDKPEDGEMITEHGSSSPWPILAAGAVHAWITTWALTEVWNAPTPIPRKLPSNIRPISYSLEILPEHQRSIFSGQESILVEVQHNTRNITLHARDLTLNSSTVSVTKELTGERVMVTDVEEEIQNQWLVIHLASDLHQDHLYKVDINYTGHITDSSRGIVLHHYENTEGRWILLTHFEPIGARYAFPCFDEPSFKARFDISIATPPGMHALSNMPLREAFEPVAGHPGWVWSSFQESVRMSTYLVGFVVSDLVGVHGARNFSVWVQPGKESEATLMAQLGPRLLEELEKFTGLPFMLPKQDNIAIPFLASMASVQGTENWGLITYTDINIIFEEGEVTKAKLRTMVHILAHELAHNWFGNLVTPVFWNDLWLKEGFARYLQFYATSRVMPTWEMEQDFQTTVLQRSLSSQDPDVFNTDVRTDKELLYNYNMRTYDTGAVMVQMMEHILTPNTFQQGIREYLKIYSYQAASSQQLFEVLDAAAVNTSSVSLPPGVGMGEVMKPWLSQIRHPLISVTRNYTSGQVTVCQEDVVGKGQSWWVPLSYTTQSELNFNVTKPRLWLSPGDTCVNMTDLVSPQEWIIFNIRQKGYYRVNYDQQNWQMLADFLNSDEFDKIDITNRIQILDEVLQLAQSKRVNMALALNVTSYLKRESNPFLWFIAIRAFSLRDGIDKNYILDLSKNLHNLIKGLPLNLLSRNAPQAWEKTVSYACSQRISPDCIKDAYERFRELQVNPSNYSIDPAFKNIILCSGLEYEQSTGEDLMFLWNLAKKQENRAEMLSILYWCLRGSEQMDRLLIALVTDGGWLTISQRSEIVWTSCGLRVNMSTLERLLTFLKKDHIESIPPVDLDLLKLVTTTIKRTPGIEKKISRFWCVLSLCWLSGTPLYFPNDYRWTHGNSLIALRRLQRKRIIFRQ